MKKQRLATALTLAVSSLLSLVALELGVRAYSGMPILAWRDWRMSNATVFDTGAVQYHPMLGWTPTPHFASDKYNTLDYGIRQNGLAESDLPTGAILAVGDSFTAGSEVNDNQSWPAILQRRLGRRVLNAGVGGYGVDQIVLNAERLLPLLKPQVLLVGMLLPENVQRAGYTVFSAPKPYFDNINGGLTLRNVPTPHLSDKSFDPAIRRILAHSLAIHLFAEAMMPEWWHRGTSGDFHHALNNPELVSCRLLERLEHTAEAQGIRTAVVIQHGGWLYARGEQPPLLVQRLKRCAERAGYQVIDEYDSLHAIAVRSLEELKAHYVMHADGSVFGHMSAQGNALIAELVAAALREPPPPPHIEPDAPLQPGRGINLLEQDSPAAYALANARIETVREAGPLKENAPVHSLIPDHTLGEHYFSAKWRANEPGPYALSLYVRSLPDTALRLQLHDDLGNGTFTDVVPFLLRDSTNAVGAARDLGITFEPAGDGWMRITLHATLPGSRGNAIVQITRLNGSTAFSARGEHLTFQGLMVEGGQTASTYCASSRCPGSQ